MDYEQLKYKLRRLSEMKNRLLKRQESLRYSRDSEASADIFFLHYEIKEVENNIKELEKEIENLKIQELKWVHI
jgi:hypothetical protein